MQLQNRSMSDKDVLRFEDFFRELYVSSEAQGNINNNNHRANFTTYLSANENSPRATWGGRLIDEANGIDNGDDDKDYLDDHQIAVVNYQPEITDRRIVKTKRTTNTPTFANSTWNKNTSGNNYLQIANGMSKSNDLHVHLSNINSESTDKSMKELEHANEKIRGLSKQLSDATHSSIIKDREIRAMKLEFQNFTRENAMITAQLREAKRVESFISSLSIKLEAEKKINLQHLNNQRLKEDELFSEKVARNSEKSRLEFEIIRLSKEIDSLQESTNLLIDELNYSLAVGNQQCNDHSYNPSNPAIISGNIVQTSSTMCVNLEDANNNNNNSIGNSRMVSLFKKFAEKAPIPECNICWEQDKNILFEPCMHVSVCMNCSKTIKTCPVCRMHIKEKRQIYL